VTLSGGEAHHALHVLRLKTAAAVELFDGRGRWASGTISQTRRDSVDVAVAEVLGPGEPALPQIHLAFSPPKGKRLDWLLEKAAELAVATLQPISCERSVVSVRGDETATRRWEAICASAVRQSGQTYLPRILPVAALADLLAAKPAGTAIIAHGRQDSPGLAAALKDWQGDDLTVLIGPEGGWTDEELRSAEAAGFLPARLGSTTLRVETAAIAVAAGAIAIWGRNRIS
jgi:16S rRNA (uracil1498-N3)-methyltransferase